MAPIGRIFGPGRQIDKLLRKAEESFGKGEWEECARSSKEARSKIDAGSPVKFSNELLRSYYLEASSHFKRGDVEKALDIITEALEQQHGLADVAKLLAEISQDHDDPRITQLLEKASRKLPDNNYVALSLCSKYVDEKKFDESSLPLFKRMYERAPENPRVIFGLAMCCKQLEKYDRTTLNVFRRAFHEFSTNQDFLYALARTYASQTPPVSESLPVIERALKFFPDEESFKKAKIAVLAHLPVLTPEQVKVLVATYKKTKDPELADKLVDHLLAAHADDEDACRVYEVVWKDHPKRTTLLSILAERYRLGGRRDPQAMEVFQAFFDDMPRERENTIYLARRYAESKAQHEDAVLVYQQALKEGAGTDLSDVVKALASAHLNAGRVTEEAARIYRMAHAADPDNYDILKALKEVAMRGGRMEGSRANPLLEYIKHPETSTKDAKALALKIGPVLAKEGRSDEDACRVYRINVGNRTASKEEEELLAGALVESGKAEMKDIPLLERVYERSKSDSMAVALADLYRQTGSPSERSLPIIFRALELKPGDRKLAGWSLAYILNQHGQDERYFPLLADMISRGHLSAAEGVRPGVVAQTTTRIARDKIRESKFKEAIQILSEAFKVDKNPILQYLLGVSYQGSGDYQTGLGIFKDLQRADRQNPAYRYRIAVLKLMSGDASGAKKELDVLEGQYPDHPMVRLRQGMVLEGKGKRSDALAEYEHVRSGDKSVVAFADYRKGIIKCTENEWEEGLKLLDRAAGGGIQTPALDEARLIARTVLADRNIESGNLDGAEALLNELPGQKKPPWAQIANERYLRLAILHFQKGDEKAARRVLEAAEKTGIRDARTSSLHAMADISAGRPKAAMERLERSLGLRDKVGAELAHKIWSVICLRLGRHEAARDAAEWLMAHKVPGAVKLRFLGIWRNPIEIDWPPALEEYTYADLETKLGFPVGLIGRMAYKRADYERGAAYLEKYYKDEKKPDRVEAEFLLGLMYIKLKKPNLGLHYWSHILQEGHRELSGKQRIDALMLLGYHFLEHGEPEKSREAFKLAGEAGASPDDIDRAISLSHLQAGYMAAKSDNLQGAIREWETILKTAPNNWQALQNLGLAHFWLNDDERAMEYFDRLFTLCQEQPEAIDEEEFSFVLEETRKMINHLVSLKQIEPTRAEVKREMTLDELRSANRNYWTLGVKKGVTAEEAQANYFRLVKIYNPEKYPRDFMVLEKAYEFFAKPGLLKKNEQLVFNAFHFRQLGLEAAGGLTEIPPSPSVVEYLKTQLNPKTHVDLGALLEDSLSREETLPELTTSPDYSVPDYLASW